MDPELYSYSSTEGRLPKTKYLSLTLREHIGSDLSFMMQLGVPCRSDIIAHMENILNRCDIEIVGQDLAEVRNLIESLSRVKLDILDVIKNLMEIENIQFLVLLHDYCYENVPR